MCIRDRGIHIAISNPCFEFWYLLHFQYTTKFFKDYPAVKTALNCLLYTSVLGMLDGKAVCIPGNPRINGNLAVYGSSGSMKTRSFCMNRILQAAVSYTHLP